MNNVHPSDSNHEALESGNTFASRRDTRANNMTGALPPVTSARAPASVGSFNFEAMLTSLHELFEHDRQVSSQPDGRRCGLCYLHFFVNELTYQDDGYYVCESCARSLGKQTAPMLRKQQK